MLEIKEGMEFKNLLNQYGVEEVKNESSGKIREVNKVGEKEDIKIYEIILEGYYREHIIIKNNKIVKHIYVYECGKVKYIEDRNLLFLSGHDNTHLVWLDTLDTQVIHTH